MAVYVDNMAAGFGRMKMCHMIADTTEELLAMADKIGVQRKWLQYPGSYKEHFDIAKSKRAIAVAAGAIEIEPVQTAAMCRRRRYTGALGSPADAVEWGARPHARSRGGCRRAGGAMTAVLEDEEKFFEIVQTTPDLYEADGMVRTALDGVAKENIAAMRRRDNDRQHELGRLRERLRGELHRIQNIRDSAKWQAAVKAVCGDEAYQQCVVWLRANNGTI